MKNKNVSSDLFDSNKQIKLQNDILIQILTTYFSPEETIKFRFLSKYWQGIIDSNSYWNPLLKKENQVSENNQALQVFKKKPETREKYIGFGKIGREYVNKLIDKKLKDSALTDVQKEYLGSKIVRNAICRSEISIENAIERVSVEKIKGLNPEQIRGLKIGLTREQVDNRWFSDAHTNAIEDDGMKYEDIKGLNLNQLNKFVKDKKEEQKNELNKTKISQNPMILLSLQNNKTGKNGDNNFKNSNYNL